MATRPTGYRGQGFSLRGEKGRFVLPPAFRKAFAENGDPSILCVAKHDRYSCLIAFGFSRTEGFEDLLDKEEEKALRCGAEFDRDIRSMQLYGFAEIPFDASGRFILPDHLQELGGLSDGIYFQGGGQFITLWDPENLYAMGPGLEGAQATCRTMAADAASKVKRK